MDPFTVDSNAYLNRGDQPQEGKTVFDKTP